MQRPPRDPSVRILSARTLLDLLPTAVAMAIGTLVVLATSDSTTQNTMAFTTFVLLQLGDVLAVRSGDSPVLTRQLFTNRWVWLALGLVVVVQVAVVHLGALQTLFDTTALSGGQWLTAGAVALVPIAIAELRGRLRARQPSA
jgi:Ca2+-transporting ATPase